MKADERLMTSILAMENEHAKLNGDVGIHVKTVELKGAPASV